MIYFTGFLIIILIFTNAITDAPNAISTTVGTKVLSFRKAAFLSSVFNFIGIVAMCFLNFSVAKNMARIISFQNEKEGIIAILSAILSTIIFALIALKYGIPTSETHSLVAGLTGASIGLNKYNNINLDEWIKIIIGLFWSIICTYIICKIIKISLKNFIDKISKKNIKKYQFFSCLLLSFMHGAQDGLKFIGLCIIYICSLKNMVIPSKLFPENYFWIIVFVSSIMSIGVGLGGRTIVENIGTNITKLSNSDAFLTDISTGITLFMASLFGIPVSTSHCKTISIISVGKEVNIKQVKEIFKAWIITFPVCFFLSFLFSKILLLNILT